MRVSLQEIPAGNRGLQHKLAELDRLKRGAVADPRFRELALEVVRRAPEKDSDAEARAVSWFTRRVRYTRDPWRVELFQSPQRLAAQTLRGLGAGDCDDMALLNAALLESIGYQTRWVIGGNGTTLHGEPAWGHIWTEWAHPLRGWQSLDDTAKRRPPGWRPDSHFDTMHRTTPSQTMHDLPDTVDLTTWPATLGGLGRMKLKRLQRAAGRLVPKPVAKVARSAERFGKKALGPAAALVSIVPGIGPAVAIPVAAAAAAQKAAKAKKARRAFLAQQAAQQADAAEEFQPQGGYELVDNAPVPEYAPPAIPEAYSQPMEPAELPDDAGAYAIDPAPVFPEDIGVDWSELFNQASNVVSQIAPKVLDTAAAGGFGRRAARLASSRGIQTAAQLVRGVQLKPKAPAAPSRPGSRPAPKGKPLPTARTAGAESAGGLPLLWLVGGVFAANALLGKKGRRR